jgi:hypothetical protein
MVNDGVNNEQKQCNSRTMNTGRDRRDCQKLWNCISSFDRHHRERLTQCFPSKFSLQIPKQMTLLTDTDSSVEIVEILIFNW